MAKITQEMIKYAFAMFMEKRKKDAVNELSTKYSMNKASAYNYIDDYKCKRDGKRYGRTMKNDATEHFLRHIYADNGNLNDYESLGRGKLYGIRQIYEECSKLLK